MVAVVFEHDPTRPGRAGGAKARNGGTGPAEEAELRMDPQAPSLKTIQDLAGPRA